MPTICPGVDFDIIAREWRCKWTEDSDKKSLQELQASLLEVMPKVAAVSGARVQRIVCGGCHDFKVITSLPAEKFAAWEKDAFAPEADFLETIKKIAGVSAVETQTFTLMPVRYTPPPKLKKPKMWSIGRLNPDDKGFAVEGKVLDEPKAVEGSKNFEVLVGDKSGKIVVSLKEDQVDTFKSLPESKVMMFRNVRVTMVKGHMRLICDKWGKMDPSADTTIEEVGEKNVSDTEYELKSA
jgi:hypothetical protein